jgi:hypothetical protein
MEITGNDTATGPCEPCLKGKQSHHGIHKTMVTRTHRTCSPIFSDICRLLATQSQNGHIYFITLTDDSCKASTYGPCKESQVGQALNTFIFQAKPSTGQKVKVSCSNSGSKRMVGHLQEVPHYATPLCDTSLTHALDSVTPEDAFSGNKPDISRL